MSVIKSIPWLRDVSTRKQPPLNPHCILKIRRQFTKIKKYKKSRNCCVVGEDSDRNRGDVRERRGGRRCRCCSHSVSRWLQMWWHADRRQPTPTRNYCKNNHVCSKVFFSRRWEAQLAGWLGGVLSAQGPTWRGISSVWLCLCTNKYSLPWPELRSGLAAFVFQHLPFQIFVGVIVLDILEFGELFPVYTWLPSHVIPFLALVQCIPIASWLFLWSVFPVFSASSYQKVFWHIFAWCLQFLEDIHKVRTAMNPAFDYLSNVEKRNHRTLKLFIDFTALWGKCNVIDSITIILPQNIKARMTSRT